MKTGEPVEQGSNVKDQDPLNQTGSSILEVHSELWMKNSQWESNHPHTKLISKDKFLSFECKL